jgi:KaiC/GvpD/RAD55 family RecA-like ATPase
MVNIKGMIGRRDVFPNTTSLAFQVQKSAEAEKFKSMVNRILSMCGDDGPDGRLNMRD